MKKASKVSRGQGLNSANVLMSLARDDAVQIPSDIELTPQEARLWPQFTRARASGDWGEFEKILLVKIVKLEAVIRDYQAMVKGPIVVNRKGTPIPNPLIAIIDTLTRQQLAIIRSLSLTKQGDPRTSANHAAQSRTFDQYLAADNDDGLFARPQ